MKRTVLYLKSIQDAALTGSKTVEIVGSCQAAFGLFDGDRLMQINEAARALRDQGRVEIASAFLDAMYRIPAVDVARDEQSRQMSEFVEAISIEELAARAAVTRGVPALNLNRDETFECFFLEPLRVAREILIIDPYASTAVCDQDVNRHWFLSKILAKSSGQITVYSRTNLSESARHQTIHETSKQVSQAWSKLVADNGEANGRITLRTLDKPDKRRGERFHERMVRMKFDANSMEFKLGNGIDTFSTSIILGGTISELPAGQINAHIQKLPSQIQVSRF